MVGIWQVQNCGISDPQGDWDSAYELLFSKGKYRIENERKQSNFVDFQEKGLSMKSLYNTNIYKTIVHPPCIFKQHEKQRCKGKYGYLTSCKDTRIDEDIYNDRTEETGIRNMLMVSCLSTQLAARCS
jgi:Zn/Cd-binding protein ZinT